jgi:MFS family permease
MWVFMSTVITIGAHALLAFSFLNPYIGTIIMGMAYSMLASSLWPLVALIIPEYQLGTAYGICQSVQNLGLAVVSMFAGYIVDKGGYLMLELFFIGWLSGEFYRGFKLALRVTQVISRPQIPQQSTQVSFSIPKTVALLATVIIWLQDFNNNGVLNMTPSERDEIAKQAISPLSINDDEPHIESSDNGAGQAREVRNKYLNRIGVNEAGNGSDTEPLLQ